MTTSPGKAEDPTGSGMGVVRHVGCHIHDVADLGKQCSECIREKRQARRVKEPHQDGGEIRGQVCMRLR